MHRTPSSMERVQLHQNKTAADLYKILASGSTENIFISPFSISTVMTMIWSGAANNTAKELQVALSLPESRASVHDGYCQLLTMLQNTPNVVLNTANRLYVSAAYPILPNYPSLLEEKYLALLRSVNFDNAPGSCKLINSEVESLTHGRIKDLIEPQCITTDTRAVLVNAIYFRGTWVNKFKPHATTPQAFFISQNDWVETKMMHLGSTVLRCDYSKDGTCKALELPYEGDCRLSMVILLPNTLDGLSQLEAQLAHTSIKDILDQLPHQEAIVSLPKFRLQISYDLVKELQSLGIKDLFHRDHSDLSGISIEKNLFISKVIHKTFLDVTEEGTEAAAATAAVMMFGCAAPRRDPPFEFIADHPFFFAIVDSVTGLTLFSGRLSKP